MKRHGLRILLTLTVAALAALLLTPAVAAKTEITFWHTYNTQSPEEETLVKKIIPAFEAKNPDIKVVAQNIPYQEMHQKLVTSVAGGMVPDLVRMDIIWVPEFANLGALEPLDDKPGFKELSDVVFKGPLSTNYWKGKYYGLPLDTNTQVFLYNKDIFAKAGLKPPKTWDDFAKMAATLTKKSGNKTTQYGYALPGPWAWYFLPWVWSNGGAITDPKITKATGYLNSPETIEAVEFLVDLYKKGYLAPTIAQSGLGSWEGMGGNLYASTQDGPWAFPSLEGQYKNLKLGADLMPAGRAGSISIVGGEDVRMFAGSKNKEAAWKFMKFLLEPWAQMEMAKVGQIPVREDVIDDPYFRDHPYYGIYLQQLKTAKARTPHPAYSKIEDIMQQAFQKVVAGKATAKQAFDDAAKQVDALLR